jgi:restriction endonuclease Mrr
MCSGRSRDRGIDFRGVWHLPDQSVPIIGQCKNEKKTLSSRYIREFIGTLNEEKHSVVGIFVSNSRFSKECRLTAAVDVPLLFCQLENNKLVGVYLNTAAQKRLPNLTITTQNDPHGQKTIYLMYFLKKP